MAEPTPVYTILGDSFNPLVSQSESAKVILDNAVSASQTSVLSSTKNSNTIFSFITSSGYANGTAYSASFQARVNGGPWTTILATNLQNNSTSTFVVGRVGTEAALYKVTFPGDVRMDVTSLSSGSLKIIVNSSN